MPIYRYYRTFRHLERDIGDIARPYFDTPTTRRSRSGRYPESETGSYAPQWAVRDRLTDGPKADLRAAALRDVEIQLAKFTEPDFAVPSNRKKYRALRSAQEELRQKVNARIDRRFYQPAGHEWPYTKLGTAARYSSFTSLDGRPLFHRKSALIPCIKRYVRRSVMFALGKGGKGFRVKHKRNHDSEVPC